MTAQVPEPRPALAAALQAERWIRGAAYDTLGGRDWRWAPDSLVYDSQQSAFIYSGTAGIILFYLELFHSTRRREHLREALKGADRLIHAIPDTLPRPEEVGLYTGLAGISFTLDQCYRLSGRKKYRLAARRALDRIAQAAMPAGEGVTWGHINEIVYGAAGVGLTFLYAQEQMDYKRGLELSVEAGAGLLAEAIREPEGWRWPWSPELASRNYPNFAHGTAGVSYFLARLYQASGERRFLEGALAGAAYLEAHTNEQGLVFRNSPGAEDVFYLGWCHGIAGTGRLYYLLGKITGDQKWMDKLLKAAGHVRTCGIPQQRTSGFWNNVGQCCGSAGLARFYLDLFGITGDKTHLEFARVLTDDLLLRATPAGGGIKWVHAENRSQPNWVMAQTGYMQGAAGIGVWLLQLDAFEQGKKPFLRLPDDPSR